MKRTAFAIMVIFCNFIFAQMDYSSIVTNMGMVLEQKDATLNVSFTNCLSEWSRDLTNVSSISSVRLVYAISLADIAEENLDGESLLPQAVSICSNIVTSTELSTNAWQRGIAGVVLSGIYSFSGKRLEACRMATNEAVMAASDVSRPEDDYLWKALAKHLSVEGLTVQEAIRCYAAVALIANDLTSDIVAYTNGLPISVLVRINEFME